MESKKVLSAEDIINAIKSTQKDSRNNMWIAIIAIIIALLSFFGFDRVYNFIKFIFKF